MKNKHNIKSFWKSLPTKSLIKLLIAIFFLFSSLGFIVDLFSNAELSYNLLAVNVIFSGILGVLYGLGAMKNWKIILLAIFLHLSYSTLFVQKITSVGNVNIEQKLFVIAVGLIITISLAYISFIIFIVGEGLPHIKLKTEMYLAKQMHDVLVPVIELENEKFSIYGKSLPVTEVGGDLVDVYSSNNNLLCYIADVSGHGVSAGLLMGMFKSSIRTTLLVSKSLKEIFNNANKALNKLKKQNMFLTSAAIKFSNNYSAEFSIAGHLPILHYNIKNKFINELHIKQIPISVKPDFNFNVNNITYSSGDIFILLSDGITEVFNKENEQFGLSRIKEIVLNNSTLSVKELSYKIFNEADTYGNQIDDQSLMLIKCK